MYFVGSLRSFVSKLSRLVRKILQYHQNENEISNVSTNIRLHIPKQWFECSQIPGHLPDVLWNINGIRIWPNTTILVRLCLARNSHQTIH